MISITTVMIEVSGCHGNSNMCTASGVLWVDNNIHTHTHTYSLSLFSLTLSNVFEMYLNIIVPVRSAVLMPAAKGMEYLVQYNTLALTAPAD